ncbi:MAG TPA: hypothetical protein VM074_04265 [Solimonas sp.]|nr:hypothetical protein [Solimonas sp.]
MFVVEYEALPSGSGERRTETVATGPEALEKARELLGQGFRVTAIRHLDKIVLGERQLSELFGSPLRN